MENVESRAETGFLCFYFLTVSSIFSSKCMCLFNLLVNKNVMLFIYYLHQNLGMSTGLFANVTFQRERENWCDTDYSGNFSCSFASWSAIHIAFHNLTDRNADHFSCRTQVFLRNVEGDITGLFYPLMFFHFLFKLFQHAIYCCLFNRSLAIWRSLSAGSGTI